MSPDSVKCPWAGEGSNRLSGGAGLSPLQPWHCKGYFDVRTPPPQKKHLVPEGSMDGPKSVLSVTDTTASSIFVLVSFLALHCLVLPGTGVFTCTHLPYSTQRPATSPPNLFPFLRSQISPAQKALLDVPVCAQQRSHFGRQPGLTAEPSMLLLESGQVGVASWSITAAL